VDAAILSVAGMGAVFVSLVRSVPLERFAAALTAYIDSFLLRVVAFTALPRAVLLEVSARMNSERCLAVQAVFSNASSKACLASSFSGALSTAVLTFEVKRSSPSLFCKVADWASKSKCLLYSTSHD